MLVLTRKHQEKIRIGDNITITILKTKGKAVRVGIEAPDDVAVVRGELAAKVAAAVASSVSSEEAGTESSAAGRRARCAMPARSVWTTESRPSKEDLASRREPVMEVTLQRVPRKQAVKLLPRLAGEASPLRSLIESRATVST